MIYRDKMKEISKSLQKKFDKNKKDLIEYLYNYDLNDKFSFEINYETVWAWHVGNGYSSIRVFKTDNGYCVIQNSANGNDNITTKELIDSLNRKDCRVLVVNNKNLEKDWEEYLVSENKNFQS